MTTPPTNLAILDLTSVMPIEQIYTLITDAATAEDAALNAIEHTDLALLTTLATAATHVLRTRPSTWGLVRAVLLLAADQPDPAYEIAHQLAEHTSSLQRRAHTIRLRALGNHHPDLPGLDTLITIINPDSTES